MKTKNHHSKKEFLKTILVNKDKQQVLQIDKDQEILRETVVSWCDGWRRVADR